MANNEEIKSSERKMPTANEALAYIANKFQGLTAKQIAEKTGKGKRTIDRYIADFDDFIRHSPEYQAFIQACPRLITKSLRVYEQSVDNGDLTAARDILKYTGIYVDRKQDIGGGGITNKTDEELLTDIAELIAGSPGASGEPDSPAEDPSEDGAATVLPADGTPE